MAVASARFTAHFAAAVHDGRRRAVVVVSGASSFAREVERSRFVEALPELGQVAENLRARQQQNEAKLKANLLV